MLGRCRKGRRKGPQTPQAWIFFADLLFRVLAVSLILHLSALKACSWCEEQKQIVLISCLVKQVESTLKAHAVWLKATGCEEGRKQERWQEERLGKQKINTPEGFFFTLFNIITCTAIAKKRRVANSYLFCDACKS